MHQQLVIVLLVGLATTVYGLDLSHAAKRSTEIEPRLLNFIGDLYAQAIYPPLNHVVTSLALLSAQVLAGIAENGIPTPNGRTLHPSEAELRGFWSGLWNEAIKPPIDNALSGISLMAAQLLAGIGVNGVDLSIGKRDLTEAEMRGFFDALNEAMNSVFANVIQKPLEDALAGGALMLAQVLAGIGTNGINLSSLPGKRDLSELAGHEAELRGLFNTVGGAVVNGFQGVWNNIFQVPLENFVQNSALAAAQLFANFANNGNSVGKRSNEARGQIIDSLVEHSSGLYVNQIKPTVENALNAAVLHLAGVLANFSQNGIGRR
jgi:hypothetical protein